eukprot:scaffold1866_cov66-Cylindrotheca_fusiformis.AAC.2
MIGEGAFHKCESLKRLGLNEGLKRVGIAVFHGCESLRRVEIPSTVVNIENGAFQDCISLHRLLILIGLEEIGEMVFLAMRILSRGGHSRNYQADLAMLHFNCAEGWRESA